MANAYINTGKLEKAIIYLKKAYEISKDESLLADIKKVENMYEDGLKH